MKLIAAASCYRAVAYVPVNNFSFMSGRRKTSSTFEDTAIISSETTDRCVVSLSKTLYLLSIVLLNSNMTEKMMLVT